MTRRTEESPPTCPGPSRTRASWQPYGYETHQVLAATSLKRISTIALHLAALTALRPRQPARKLPSLNVRPYKGNNPPSDAGRVAPKDSRWTLPSGFRSR